MMIMMMINDNDLFFFELCQKIDHIYKLLSAAQVIRDFTLSTQPQSSVQGPLQQQGPSPGSWSTQSLSRSRGGSLAAKLPLRAVNGRISELLQGSAGSRSRTHGQGGGTDTAEERGVGLARCVRFPF